ncbi:PQQ-dependent sugar dehydrogenase [Sagittula sp. SSi028]|uniref:PQQ-dependent sugar dehydrogenase n=1 Tax=Sagittula sp. SSi028 TaxID=3400636 RepID=UPI003AF89300
MTRFPFAAALALMAQTVSLGAQTVQTEAGTMQITAMVEGLDTPWAFAHLPDGGLLITEREGGLLSVRDGAVTRVAGLPDDIVAEGQGGLLDILIPEDFARTRKVYLTYAKRQGRGAGTAVFRATLSQDGTGLTNGQTIFKMAPGDRSARHFGSRIVEGADGYLYITIGERGDRPAAQDLARHNGSIIRIARDGSVPPDNPFVGQSGAQPEIWSYGHRNPQGAAVDADGQLWINEHGAQGGDEVNRIVKGANYGWPVISYGRHYSGAKIGEGTAKDGMQQPEFYWDPSIAPSGMVFYDGPVSQWRGDAFVGSLKFDYIARLSGDPLREVEQIRADQTGRVRDLAVGPDGGLWFLSITNGTLYRMSPAD